MWKGGSISANSAFGVLSSVVPYQLALHIQLHSACLCQTWGGGRGSNPSSQPRVCKTFGSWVFMPAKMLSYSAELLPFSWDLFTLWHTGQTPATPAEQHFTQSRECRSRFCLPSFYSWTAPLQQGQGSSHLYRKQQDVVDLLRWSKALWGGLLANSTGISQLHRKPILNCQKRSVPDGRWRVSKARNLTKCCQPPFFDLFLNFKWDRM